MFTVLVATCQLLVLTNQTNELYTTFLERFNLMWSAIRTVKTQYFIKARSQAARCSSSLNSCSCYCSSAFQSKLLDFQEFLDFQDFQNSQVSNSQILKILSFSKFQDFFSFSNSQIFRIFLRFQDISQIFKILRFSKFLDFQTF